MSLTNKFAYCAINIFGFYCAGCVNFILMFHFLPSIQSFQQVHIHPLEKELGYAG